MVDYSLSPAYVVFDYHSEFAPHVQVLPTREWNPVSLTGTMGTFANWVDANVDAEDMIDNFILKAKPFLHPTSSYDRASIFTKADDVSPSFLVASKSLAVVGTSAASSPRKAVQATFNFKSTVGHPMKIVFLDYPHGPADFNKQRFGDISADAVALYDEIALPVNGWSARDNTRVTTFVSVTNTLNEKLRKQYKMG